MTLQILIKTIDFAIGEKRPNMERSDSPGSMFRTLLKTSVFSYTICTSCSVLKLTHQSNESRTNTKPKSTHGVLGFGWGFFFYQALQLQLPCLALSTQKVLRGCARCCSVAQQRAHGCRALECRWVYLPKHKQQRSTQFYQEASTTEAPHFPKRTTYDARKWFFNTEFPSVLG